MLFNNWLVCLFLDAMDSNLLLTELSASSARTSLPRVLSGLYFPSLTVLSMFTPWILYSSMMDFTVCKSFALLASRFSPAGSCMLLKTMLFFLFSLSVNSSIMLTASICLLMVGVGFLGISMVEVGI